MAYNRITIEPEKMGGAPCIRGLRIPVATIVNYVGSGMTVEEVLGHYPDLVAEDVYEAIRYAADAVREHTLPMVRGS